MRRLSRTADYQITLEITNDDFIATPKPSQRSRVVVTRLGELATELDQLHHAAQSFVAGGAPEEIVERSRARLSADHIMEDWQAPIMAAMARAVTHNQGDVLEIGFGRGVAAGFVQDHMPASHTLIECNPAVIEDFFSPWKASHPGRDIRMVEGLWEETLDGLARFDGILFHTYPLSSVEYIERVQKSVTFAAHFFEHAAAHLKPGGRFTYLTMEEDSLSRAHQRALLTHFASFTVSRIDGLAVPDDTRDAHWSHSMVLVEAVGK